MPVPNNFSHEASLLRSYLNIFRHPNTNNKSKVWNILKDLDPQKAKNPITTKAKLLERIDAIERKPDGLLEKIANQIRETTDFSDKGEAFISHLTSNHPNPTTTRKMIELLRGDNISSLICRKNDSELLFAFFTFINTHCPELLSVQFPKWKDIVAYVDIDTFKQLLEKYSQHLNKVDLMSDFVEACLNSEPTDAYHKYIKLIETDFPDYFSSIQTTAFKTKIEFKSKSIYDEYRLHRLSTFDWDAGWGFNLSKKNSQIVSQILYLLNTLIQLNGRDTFSAVLKMRNFRWNLKSKDFLNYFSNALSSDQLYDFLHVVIQYAPQDLYNPEDLHVGSDYGYDLSYEVHGRKFAWKYKTVYVPGLFTRILNNNWTDILSKLIAIVYELKPGRFPSLIHGLITATKGNLDQWLTLFNLVNETTDKPLTEWLEDDLLIQFMKNASQEQLDSLLNMSLMHLDNYPEALRIFDLLIKWRSMEELFDCLNKMPFVWHNIIKEYRQDDLYQLLLSAITARDSSIFLKLLHLSSQECPELLKRVLKEKGAQLLFELAYSNKINVFFESLQWLTKEDAASTSDALAETRFDSSFSESKLTELLGYSWISDRVCHFLLEDEATKKRFPVFLRSKPGAFLLSHFLKFPVTAGRLCKYFPLESHASLHHLIAKNDKSSIQTLFSCGFSFNSELFIQSFKKNDNNQPDSLDMRYIYKNMLSYLVENNYVDVLSATRVTDFLCGFDTSYYAVEPVIEEERKDIYVCCYSLLKKLGIDDSAEQYWTKNHSFFMSTERDESMLRRLSQFLNPKHELYQVLQSYAIIEDEVREDLHHLLSWKKLPNEAQKQCEVMFIKSQTSTQSERDLARCVILLKDKIPKISNTIPHPSNSDVTESEENANLRM